MRALFSCVPGFGHFHPMVPLARAMQAGGHEVAFATAERFCRGVVEPAGFRAFPAGLSPLEVGRRMTGPASGPGGPASGPGGPAPGPEEGWRLGARMFAGVAGPPKAADLTRVIAGWRPHLVVHDSFDFGAPVAAAAAGLPWAAHSFGALQPAPLWERAEALLAPTWRERGMEPAERGGIFRHLYLDICPPSLQSPAITEVASARLLRPVPFDAPRGEQLPAWVAELDPRRPTLYVTLGTVFNTTPGRFEAILAALAGPASPALNVVATVGPGRHPAEVGPQPDHVHVEAYLPQSLLLPHCHAVVCHGGSGTTLAALAHGLPLLVLPQGADQRRNGERCAALGAGAVLEASDLGPEALGATVSDLLSRPGYRQAAGLVAAEIAGMPDPQGAVPALEALARSREP